MFLHYYFYPGNGTFKINLIPNHKGKKTILRIGICLFQNVKAGISIYKYRYKKNYKNRKMFTQFVRFKFVRSVNYRKTKTYNIITKKQISVWLISLLIKTSIQCNILPKHFDNKI